MFIIKSKKGIFIISIIIIFFTLIIFLSFKQYKKIIDQNNNNQEYVEDKETIFQNPIIVVKHDEPQEIKTNNLLEVDINNEKVSIDIGKNTILSKNIFNLNDNYTLIELLVSRNGEVLEFLNDSQLSSSYDYAIKYSKIWYLYNNDLKSLYEIENNYKKNELSLSPKIEDNYFEFNKMFYKSNGKHNADHYKILITDLILILETDGFIEWRNYSYLLDNSPNFKKENLIKTVNHKEDLNNDNKEDNISLEVYESYEINEMGYILTINDKKIEVLNDFTQASINILDFKESDDFKEIMIITGYNDEKIINTHIYNYDGTNINKMFYSTNLEIKSSNKDVNYLDYKLNDDDIWEIKEYVKDTTQNWTLVKRFKLKDDHTFANINSGYYENTYRQEIIALDNLITYDSMDYNDKSETFLNKNEKAYLIGTDLNHWLVIELNGNIKYIALDDFGNIKDLGVFPGSVFEGLIISD